MTNERVLQKIKRCLALGRSANENESASALRQAHALMQKYGIKMDDVGMADIESHLTKAKIPKKPTLYQSSLIHEIARLFACKPLITTNKKFDIVVKFVGFEHYPQIASYAFDVLNRQLTKARKEYIATELKRVRKRANKTARADNYCMGWVIAVCEKLEDLAPPNVNVKLIEQYIEEKIQPTYTAKARDRNHKVAIHNDMYKGFNDGEKAQLHNAMGNTERKQIAN